MKVVRVGDISWHPAGFDFGSLLYLINFQDLSYGVSALDLILLPDNFLSYYPNFYQAMKL